jgi:predicted lipid carrier protein YhbT
MPPALAFAVALNALAWPLLKMRGMEGMVGKRYCIHVTDLNLRVRFGLNPEGFVAQPDGPSDLTVRASSRDFLQLVLRREDPDTLFFSRRLVMEGDTELGLQVKNTLDAIDPEEGLALLPPLPAGLVRTWLASAAA